jgi:hypothetical protein
MHIRPQELPSSNLAQRSHALRAREVKVEKSSSRARPTRRGPSVNPDISHTCVAFLKFGFIHAFEGLAGVRGVRRAHLPLTPIREGPASTDLIPAQPVSARAVAGGLRSRPNTAVNSSRYG